MISISVPKFNGLDAAGDRRNGGAGNGGDSGIAEEGEESDGLRIVLLVKEEILRYAESAVEANGRDAEHEGGDKDGTNTGEENNKDGESRKKSEGFEIGESATENNKRAIGGSEEVKEGPRTKEANEEDEGERVS